MKFLKSSSSIILLSMIISGCSSFKKSLQRGYDIDYYVKDFSLLNLTGQKVSMRSFKNGKGNIIVFMNSLCPYDRAYTKRLVELNDTYYRKGIGLIIINTVNPYYYKKYDLTYLTNFIAEHKIEFPYLIDLDSKVAKRFGATTTPQAYLVQRVKNKNIVRYIGGIYMNYTEFADKKHNELLSDKFSKTDYLEVATISLLKGEKVKIKKTKPIGCPIRYK